MNEDVKEQPILKKEATGSGTVLSPGEVQRGFVGGIIFGLISLIKGMMLTFGYFSHPSTVVTQQYPENRDTLKMCERFRSLLVMPHDQDGCHNCTACGICQTACPNASINVVSAKDVAGKKILKNYIWRMDTCTFCNACVQACPFSALAMTGSFEGAVYDRRLLIYLLNRYAGPPANALKKIADPAERKKMMEPCLPYSGWALPGETISSAGGR